MQVTVTVNVVQIGPKWVAMAEIGGMRVRSSPSNKPEPALKNLFWKLSGNGPQDDDAELGMALLLAGTTLEAEIKRDLPPALPAPSDEPAPSWAVWAADNPGKTHQDYVNEWGTDTGDPWAPRSST